jgi:histidine decarboxylase
VKDLEVELIDMVADLLNAPPDDRWGYVTADASEGILWSLRLARRLLGGAIVLHSAAAHPAVPDAVDTLGLRSLVLAADDSGELDYADLEAQVATRRDQKIIVVATAGTTWTEAVDDVRRITAVLDRQHIPAGRRFILVDAAFAGFPLAVLDPQQRPGFDLADGADAVVISTHKIPGTPTPGAAVITRDSLIRATVPVGYTGTPHSTLSCSRNGHAVVATWYALQVLNRGRLAEIFAECRDLAGFLHTELAALGWHPARNPLAMTVTFDAPPAPVRARHHLAEIDGRSHIVCAPGITRADLDPVFAGLAAARPTAQPAAAPAVKGRRMIPRPRRRAGDGEGRQS